ncbi:MAG: hypothetical protein ABIP85_27740 [Chthoniobacteraceae bacterium]
MPSPKSGSAPSAVSPADPKNACEADNAEPGTMSEVKARQKESDDGSAAHKASKSQEEKEKEKKTSWIEIEMVDQEKKPVVGLPFRITLPDGKTVSEGTLNEKGFARVSNIEPGSCKVTFPTLDQEAWEEM